VALGPMVNPAECGKIEGPAEDPAPRRLSGRRNWPARRRWVERADRRPRRADFTPDGPNLPRLNGPAAVEPFPNVPPRTPALVSFRRFPPPPHRGLGQNLARRPSGRPNAGSPPSFPRRHPTPVPPRAGGPARLLNTSPSGPWPPSPCCGSVPPRSPRRKVPKLLSEIFPPPPPALALTQALGRPVPHPRCCFLIEVFLFPRHPPNTALWRYVPLDLAHAPLPPTGHGKIKKRGAGPRRTHCRPSVGGAPKFFLITPPRVLSQKNVTLRSARGPALPVVRPAGPAPPEPDSRLSVSDQVKKF